MYNPDYKFWIKSILFFFILPIIVYWGVITHFTFNLFYPDWLSYAYNYYLLSMLEGRLDVPLEAIGAEGVFYNDKVYMYYGILPALARLLVYPFVDLETVSVSRLIIFLFCASGVAIMQWVLLRHYLSTKRNTEQFFILLIISFTLWFGSVHLSIVQNGSLYQEPYAASLFLIACYLALFANDVLLKPKERKFRLKTYALISALALFARPNIAVFLYVQTVIVILFDVYTSFKLHAGRRVIVKLILGKATLPLVILLIGGMILLIMNHQKFDDPFSLSKGSYGYYLLEGNSQKFCGFRQSGGFNSLRILPHAIYYFVADYDLFKTLSSRFGLGYVSVGVPASMLVVAWTLACISLIWMSFVHLVRFRKTIIKDFPTTSFWLLSTGSMLVILSYGTIEYRYSADLWLPFGLALLWGYGRLIDKAGKTEKHLVGIKKLFITAILIFLTLASPLYTMSHYELAFYSQMRRAGDYDINKDSFIPNKSTIERLKNPPDRSEFVSCEERENVDDD